MKRSVNHYLIMVEEFVCPRDPGAMLSGAFRVTHGKLVQTKSDLNDLYE